MLSGVPKKEYWWLWLFFAWLFFSMGPGVMLASKPVFIGYFPLLFVWSLVFFVISLLLTFLLAYKVTFKDVPETFENEDEEGKV